MGQGLGTWCPGCEQPRGTGRLGTWALGPLPSPGGGPSVRSSLARRHLAALWGSGGATLSRPAGWVPSSSSSSAPPGERKEECPPPPTAISPRGAGGDT